MAAEIVSSLLGHSAPEVTPAPTPGTSNASRYATHCNTTYSASADSPANVMPSNPGPPPTAKMAIITCMDARIDPFRMFDLKLGESHIIRVGGGRAPDALRSLLASEHVLGTNEIMVIHHTDCGFTKAPSEDLVRKEVGVSCGLSVEHINFMPIGSLKQSIKDDILFLRVNPYLRKEVVISGWLYDTLKGTIEEVKVD
jgi:carbonic anhydrase